MSVLDSSFSFFPGYLSIATTLPNVGIIGFNDGSPIPNDPQPPSSGIGSSSDPNNTGGVTPLARNIFAATQTTVDTHFNSHPAIRMLMNFAKRTIRDKDLNWNSSNLQQTVFPGLDISTAPRNLSVGSLSYDQINQGGCAMLIKAFYNACRDWQDRIDVDRASQQISELNGHIWRNRTGLLTEYFRHVFLIKPSNELVEKYKALLLSTAYKNIKIALANQSGWINSNLEMFCHFVKLAACGASDDTITQIYNAFVRPTDGTPAVDGGYFGSITPGTWRNYTGWLSSGLLDFSDLGATNLNSSYWTRQIPGSGAMVTTPQRIELVDIYTSRHGYRKAPKSSCFSGSTLVLLASGELRPISSIQIGELVATCIGDFLNETNTAKVVFASKTPRGTRKLYAFKDCPGIMFTSTHPFALGTATDSELSVVSFVRPLLASALNPTWRLVTCSTIEPDSLIVKVDEKSTEDEFLYDLVFEQNVRIMESCSTAAMLPTYVVGDGNGKLITAISDAPIASWLPLEAVFACSVLEEIKKCEGKLEDILGLFDSPGSFACQLIEEAASKIQPDDHPTNDIPIGDSALESYFLDDKQGQVVATLIEKMLATVGRLPNNLASIGWVEQNRSNASKVDSGHDSLELLLLRRLQIMNTDEPSLDTTLPSEWHVQLWQDEKLVVNTTKTTSESEGPTSIVFHEAYKLGKRAPESLDKPTSIRLELTGSRDGKNVALIGQGNVLKCCDTWINLIDTETVGTTLSPPLQVVVQVEIQYAAADAFKSRHHWEGARAKNMAALLGRNFGAALVKQAAAAAAVAPST